MAAESGAWAVIIGAWLMRGAGAAIIGEWAAMIGDGARLKGAAIAKGSWMMPGASIGAWIPPQSGEISPGLAAASAHKVVRTIWSK